MPILLIKYWKAGLGILLLLGFLVHYAGLRAEIQEIEAHNQRLELKNQIQLEGLANQQKALIEWRDTQKKLLQDVEEMSKVAKQAQQETGRLHDLFRKHDLGRLAAKKPGLIENRINAGTATNFRLLECKTRIGDSCDADREAGQTDSPQSGTAETPSGVVYGPHP